MARAKKASAERLIGMEPLMEIIETALTSAYLTETIPISVILIGPSGAGKSKAIMQYNGMNGCHLTNDVTSQGLQELLAGDPLGKLRFLVIPDFNLPLSHRSTTLQLTVANLLSVMSEGTVRIDDGREKKEVKHDPIGILTAMTRQLYTHVANKWAVLGFNRRFLPIYYDYSLATRQLIQDSIVVGTTTLLQLAPAKMKPLKPTSVGIGVFGNKIQVCSDELANNIGWIPGRSRKKDGTWDSKAVFIGKQLEFSPHLALRSMARAHALRDGRMVVSDADIQFLLRMIRYTRFDRPGEL